MQLLNQVPELQSLSTTATESSEGSTSASSRKTTTAALRDLRIAVRVFAQLAAAGNFRMGYEQLGSCVYCGKEAHLYCTGTHCRGNTLANMVFYHIDCVMTVYGYPPHQSTYPHAYVSTWFCPFLFTGGNCSITLTITSCRFSAVTTALLMRALSGSKGNDPRQTLTGPRERVRRNRKHNVQK